MKDLLGQLREIRKTRGYSQFYVAHELGISQNAYSKIECGNCSLSLFRLQKLAEVLDMKVTIKRDIVVCTMLGRRKKLPKGEMLRKQLLMISEKLETIKSKI